MEELSRDRPLNRCTTLGRAGVTLIGLVALTACGASMPTNAASTPAPGSTAATSPAPSATAPSTTAPSTAVTSSAPAGPTSVPVTVETTTSGRRVPEIRISVGGGPTVAVVLDTGSTGLLLSSTDVGPESQDTGTQTTYQYVGFALHAHIRTARVSIAGAPNLVTTPTAIGAVDGMFNSGATAAGADVVGILGIAAGQNDMNAPPLHSPLADLPGSLGTGYTIDLGNGRLELGPPSGNAVARITLTKTGWTYPNGLSGYEKSVPLTWHVGGVTKTLPTTLDTGAPAGFIASRLFSVSPSDLSENIRLSYHGQVLSDYSTGPKPAVSDTSTVMNSGIGVFLAHRVGLDLRAGELVIES